MPPVRPLPADGRRHPSACGPRLDARRIPGGVRASSTGADMLALSATATAATRTRGSEPEGSERHPPSRHVTPGQPPAGDHYGACRPRSRTSCIRRETVGSRRTTLRALLGGRSGGAAGCGHEWQAYVANRTLRASGCAVCAASGRAASRGRVPAARSIGVLRPDLANEMHRTLNGDLDPLALGTASNKVIWWECSTCTHTWEARVSARVAGTGVLPAGDRDAASGRRPPSR